MVILLQIFFYTVALFGTALAVEAPPPMATGVQCEVPRSLTLNRPLVDKGPTKVSMGAYVIDIIDIDDVAQSFTADFHLVIRWHDPRLSAKARGTSLTGCRLKPDDIWHPAVSIINQRKVWKRFEDNVQIDQDGKVFYRQRYFGELSSRLDLKDFPFDTQILPISLISRYSPEDISILLDERWSGLFKAFSIAGWTVDLSSTRIGKEYVAAQDRDLSRFDYNLSAKRHSGYYLWKVILPLALIVLMAGAVFLIAPTELGPRIGISTSAVLTLIIAQFTTGRLLPRVEYLTQLDKFIVGCTILVFAALGEAIITSRLARRGYEELARKINRWSYFLYPLTFAMIIIYTLVI